MVKKTIWVASGISGLQTVGFGIAMLVRNQCGMGGGGVGSVLCVLADLVLFTILLPAWGVMVSGGGIILAVATIWLVNFGFTFLTSGGIVGIVKIFRAARKHVKSV